MQACSPPAAASSPSAHLVESDPTLVGAPMSTSARVTPWARTRPGPFRAALTLLAAATGARAQLQYCPAESYFRVSSGGCIVCT